jgi:hypothetical protein
VGEFENVQKPDGTELLLQEISRTLQENRRFLQALKEDRLDRLEDEEGAEETEEDFEEL